MKIKDNILRMLVGIVLLALVVQVIVFPTPTVAATTWNNGDVFVGVASGSYMVYDNNGNYKETISSGSGYTTGAAFNPGFTHLYTTSFSTGNIVKYDDISPHASSTFAAAISTPESISFKINGGYFVGGPVGGQIAEFDATDTLVTVHSVASGRIGTDWVDLAINQTTIFYTGEGTQVKRWDTGAGQMTDFSSSLTNGFALRLLPPYDGSGGLLVADMGNIKRLDGAGAVAQTYDVSGENAWFALNLDPNGTSFWSADFGTANFYRFNIATGVVEVGPINTGTGSSTVYGLCVKGEPTGGTGGGGDTNGIIEVGGEVYPVNRLALLAPWIALIAVIIAGTTIAVRRRRAQS